jgi:putative ABC transport system ATP-binding protein
MSALDEGGPMIELEDVTRRYARGGVAALDGVSLTIDPGEFVAVTGPSGCGKSTLLNLIGGLDKPTSGVVRVGGLDLGSAADAALTRYRRHDLGIVFQFFNLLPTMSVAENIELPLLLRGDRPAPARERVREMVALVGLEPRADHFPHQLSGGEMQRTALARALAGGPKVVLADEPTGNLDSTNAARVLEALLKIASQKITTLVIVTHSDDLARTARRHITVRDGKITQL